MFGRSVIIHYILKTHFIGVLLYEIVSLGEKPYASFDNSRVLAALECGQNPGCPIECPDEIHEIMLQTWIVDAKERPSFSQILPQLERLRGKSEIQAIDPKFLKVKSCSC
jgi:hypothetical protein